MRDGENGLLVPAGDADALAAAIRRVVEDDELRAQARGRGRALGRRARARRLLGRIEAALRAAAAEP